MSLKSVPVPCSSKDSLQASESQGKGFGPTCCCWLPHTIQKLPSRGTLALTCMYSRVIMESISVLVQQGQYLAKKASHKPLIWNNTLSWLGGVAPPSVLSFSSGLFGCPECRNRGTLTCRFMAVTPSKPSASVWRLGSGSSWRLRCRSSYVCPALTWVLPRFSTKCCRTAAACTTGILRSSSTCVQASIREFDQQSSEIQDMLVQNHAECQHTNVGWWLLPHNEGFRGN